MGHDCPDLLAQSYIQRQKPNKAARPSVPRAFSTIALIIESGTGANLTPAGAAPALRTWVSDFSCFFRISLRGFVFVAASLPRHRRRKGDITVKSVSSSRAGANSRFVVPR
jgi:hypothetical protein